MAIAYQPRPCIGYRTATTPFGCHIAIMSFHWLSYNSQHAVALAITCQQPRRFIGCHIPTSRPFHWLSRTNQHAVSLTITKHPARHFIGYYIPTHTPFLWQSQSTQHAVSLANTKHTARRFIGYHIPTSTPPYWYQIAIKLCDFLSHGNNTLLLATRTCFRHKSDKPYRTQAMHFLSQRICPTMTCFCQKN